MSEALDSTASYTQEVSPFDRSELEAQIELLQEENRRLREELQSTKRSKYRRTAQGLFVVGLVSLAGAVLFPTLRTVLIALGATGVFSSVLTYFITPDRFVSATLSEGIYESLAHLGDDFVTELGLTDTRLYVPIQSDQGRSPVRLYVPQHSDYLVPDDEALRSLFVIPESPRAFGIAVTPTGVPLYREFEEASPGPASDDPISLAERLVDGLLGQFELIDQSRVDPDLDNDRIVVGIAGSSLGAVDRFDHPVGSFLGVGMAQGLTRPVSVTVDATAANDRFDYVLDCSWSAAGDWRPND